MNEKLFILNMVKPCTVWCLYRGKTRSTQDIRNFTGIF